MEYFTYHIKTYNFNRFKTIIKCWDGNHCTCRVCEHTISPEKTRKNKILNSLSNSMRNENFVKVSELAIII